MDPRERAIRTAQLVGIPTVWKIVEINQVGLVTILMIRYPHKTIRLIYNVMVHVVLHVATVSVVYKI